MDEDLILHEIVKSLAFEIEAVNQENVLKWSTTNGTPLNVKVRVRNKDEPRLVQRGTMPVPRVAISAPEKLALVSSNQTILSFSVYLQDELEKKEEHKRQSGFKLFNIGSCLGTYSDDEGPYLPSSSNQNDVESNNSVTSGSGILQKKVSQVLSTTSNAVPRNKKTFFGKCKPGGCLDPPFGEDNYAYGLSKTERRENIGLELNELEDSKKTKTKPGGCLDPSFSEEKYPYSVPKTDYQKKLGQKLDKTKDDSFQSREKTIERSKEPETFGQKITKNEGDPKKLTDIYARTSEQTSLKLKYSNSIITYPTDKHSTEKVYDQIPYKKMPVKSNDDGSLRQSYEYQESYFVPPKDVIRYKEEERRHGRRLSTDQLSRSSKVAANDMIDKSSFFKSMSQESKYLQHTKGSKDSVKDIDLAPKVTKHETATFTQSSGFKEDSSNVHHSSRNVVGLIASDTSPVKSTSRETICNFSFKELENNKTEYFQDDIDAVESLLRQQILSNGRTSQEAMIELSPKKTNMEETENLDDGINLPKMPTRYDKPSTRGTSRETMGKLSQSNLSKKAPITRTLNNENARNQEEVEFEKQPMPSLDRCVNTDKQTSTNLNQQFKNNDVKVSAKKTKGALILATAATIAVTEKESLQSKDNQNVVTDSLMKDKNSASLSNSEGHLQGGNISPTYISSTENCDFDISSSHSIDFKQELLSSGKTNGLLDISRQEDEWLSSASNHLIPKNDLRNVQLSSEREGKKTSAILQKKPFKTKLDPDIRNDDINKATPLKRNTFTIIGSDTSLQKNEEIEQIPDNITDVQLKTTDKTNLLNNINKKSETKIHTNSATSTTQSIKLDSLKDMYTNIIGTTKPISDEQTRIKEESLDKDTKKTGNILNTDFDKSFKTKNVSEPTNYQTEILDTTQKNIISSGSLPKQLLINEKPHSNIAENDESTLTVQSPFKAELLDANVQAEYTTNKDISTSHLQISDEKKLPTIFIDRKPVLDIPLSDKIELLGEYDGLGPDSLQKSTPENEQKAYPTVYDGKNVFSTQNEKLDFAGIESKESTTYDSRKPIKEMLQKPTTKIEKVVFSKIADDGNLVSIDPTSNKVDHLDTNLQEFKNKMYNTSNTGSMHKLIPENAIDLHSITKMENVQNSRALFADHNEDVSSDLLYDTNAFLNTENNEPTQKFIPEHIRDLHSGMPRKINDQAELKDQIYMEQDSAKYRKSYADVLPTPEYVQDLHSGMTVQSSDKAGIINQIYNEMASKKYSDSAKDDSQKTQLENVQDFCAPTVYDNAYVSSDRMYENMAILDTQSIEPTQKIKPEHVRHAHSAIADQSYDKTDLDDQIYNEVASIKYSESAEDDSFKIRSENVQDLHTGMPRKINDQAELKDQIYIEQEGAKYRKSSADVLVTPEYVQDLHSGMTEQSSDKAEIKKQIYNEMASKKHSDSAKDDSQKTQLENVQDFRAPTVYDNAYVSSDGIYENMAILDTQGIEPTQKIKPGHVRNSHSRMADQSYDKTDLDDQIYNEVASIKYSESAEDDSFKIRSENVQDLHTGMPRKINDQAELKDQIYIEQEGAKYRKSSADVLVTPEYVQDLHSGMTEQSSDKAEIKKQIYNEMASKKHSDSAKDDSQKTQLENVQDFRAPTVYDNAYVSSDGIYENMAILDTQGIEPTQKIKPGHVRNSHSRMADQSYDKTDLDDQIYNEVASIKYSESAEDDSFKIRSENVQDLHTPTAGYVKNISSDQIYDKTWFLNTENNEPTQTNIPVHSRDLQSVMADKTELNDQIYNDQGKVIYSEQTMASSPLHAQSADENEYLSFDQKYGKRTLLDPDSNKPQDEIEKSDVYSSKFHEQMEFAQNLTDNIHGLSEKSKSASKSNSPFSGYSGLISEVLSNISENIEGEEKQSTGIKVAERISSKLEDLAVSDTKSYRDQDMLDSEFSNIVGEPGLINLSHVKDDGSYNVPQKILVKSFTSTLEESDGNIHKETIAETPSIGHSADGLSQRSDDYPNNTLNIARDDVLLDSIIDISEQNSEYQSSKILASINDSIGLNEDGFPLTHEQPTLARQKHRKSLERGEETTYLDMSFYSYMNNNNQRVVETHSPLVEQHRPRDGTVTVVKSLIRHGNEIRIPVDKENDISLNILKKEVRISNKGGIIGSPLRQTRREKHVDLAKRHDDFINKNLSLIYEHELIPLHNVIKNLAQEVNTLSAQQGRLQMRIRNTKRTKSLRLIPVVKRCGCRRM